MKRVIEYNVCNPKDETKATLDLLNDKMEVIESFFDSMLFTRQKFEDKQLQSEATYTLPITALNKIIVDLDMAIDEFYLELKEPVTTQVFDGIARQSDTLLVEIVTEEVAVSNDKDFIGALKYRELNNDGEYCVGGINSYYSELGKVNGKTFYYREL